MIKAKSLTLSILMVLGLALAYPAAKAEPVVVGDPSKGTPITSVQDGATKVQITTTGISVEDGEEKVDNLGASHNKTVKFKGVLSELKTF